MILKGIFFQKKKTGALSPKWIKMKTKNNLTVKGKKVSRLDLGK